MAATCRWSRKRGYWHGPDRTIAVLQGAPCVYESMFSRPIIAKIEALSGRKYEEGGEVQRAIRIIADHIRCATFIMGDDKGMAPSNVDQGYVLRRLIRRAVRFGMQIGMPEHAWKRWPNPSLKNTRMRIRNSCATRLLCLQSSTAKRPNLPRR